MKINDLDLTDCGFMKAKQDYQRLVSIEGVKLGRDLTFSEKLTIEDDVAAFYDPSREVFMS